MTNKKHSIHFSLLEKFAYSIFSKAGLADFEALETAKHLVKANLRGVDSHGITRVPIYVKRIQAGVINRNVEVSILRDTPVSSYVDGNNGIGPSIAKQALDIAIQKAKNTGIAVVGLTNANHLGVLGYYNELAVNEGLVAFTTSNAPSNMPPFGGADKYFGTNPFSFAFPTKNEKPFILDMATSVVSKGKIILAEKNNQSIPLGWAIDKEGNETTDAKAGVEGLVLPLGGPKGYGLAFMVDILSGVMTGSNWGPHINDLYSNFDEPQNVGMFIFLMRPDLFIPEDEFKERLDQAIREVKSLKKQKNFDRIYIPGEIEYETMVQRMEEGIPLTEEIIEDLQMTAKDVSLNFDFFNSVVTKQ